jgi:hypothetical protein
VSYAGVRKTREGGWYWEVVGEMGGRSLALGFFGIVWRFCDGVSIGLVQETQTPAIAVYRRWFR